MLTNEQMVVVGCAVPEKLLTSAKHDLEKGLYLIDMLVRIQGTVNKGEGGERVPGNAHNFALLAALLADNVNKDVLNKVKDLYCETVNSKDAVKAKLESLKGRTEAWIVDIKGNAEPKPFSGPVSAKLVAELVGEPKIEKKQ